MEKELLHLMEWAPAGLLLFAAPEETEMEAETDRWTCLTANQAACNLLGRLPLDGLSLAELFPRNVADSLTDHALTHPFANSVDFFISNPGKWLLAAGNRMNENLVVSLTDITKQKEAAFADHRLLRLYQSLASSLADNEIILFDRDFNVILTEGNPRFIRLDVVGDLQGQRLESLFQKNHFDFLGEYTTGVFSNGKKEVEKEINGRFYRASIYADKRDEEGEEHLVGVLLLKDVSELNAKNREIELRIEQLAHANKELETFAYVASHDLQEPLRKITSFSQRLESKYGETLEDDGRMYLSRMLDATRRMGKLIDDLLLFSRATRRDKPFERTDLNECLAEAIYTLEVSIERNNAEVVVENELPAIEAMASQMQQLFQNIIGNALKFNRPGVSPLIRVRSLNLSGNDMGEHGLSSHRQYCLIEIQDNGIGFSQENAERIFTIFQRLHGRSEYEGAGVGLAICKKIVENHDGIIFARGEQGVGATISIILPFQQSTV